MLKSFIVEHCEVSPDFRVTKTDFYESYSEWERNCGRQPLHINEVGRQMKNLDFQETRTKNTRFWTGIRLINLDVATTSEAENFPSTPAISQGGFTRNASSIAEALNERLRQEMMGVCTIQKF